jgi:hypothetical protein
VSESERSFTQQSWRLGAGRAACGLVLATSVAALGLASQPARAAATDGTITITAKSADVGVGWTWGNGVLRWHGHRYPFSVKGLDVAAVGYSRVTAHGVVHNLKTLRDFDGTYAASTGEATVNKGIQGQALINSNNVQIEISGATKGARLSGAVNGIQLTLNQ